MIDRGRAPWTMACPIPAIRLSSLPANSFSRNSRSDDGRNETVLLMSAAGGYVDRSDSILRMSDLIIRAAD